MCASVFKNTRCLLSDLYLGNCFTDKKSKKSININPRLCNDVLLCLLTAFTFSGPTVVFMCTGLWFCMNILNSGS